MHRGSVLAAQHVCTEANNGSSGVSNIANRCFLSSARCDGSLQKTSNWQRMKLWCMYCVSVPTILHLVYISRGQTSAELQFLQKWSWPGSSYQPPSRFLKMTQTLTLCGLTSPFLLAPGFIRHQQKSPSHRFLSDGTLALNQCSYSALKAIFNPLSVRQIDSGFNLNPNRKSK